MNPASPSSVDGAPDEVAAHAPAITGAIATYAVLTVLLAVAGAVWGWSQWALRPEDAVTMLVLLGVGWFSAWFQDADAGDQVGLSFTSVVLIASVPLVGPAGAAIVGGFIPWFDKRRRWSVVQLFNSALIAAMGAFGGLAYGFAHGPHLEGVDHELTPEVLLLRVGLPLLLANVVVSVINAALLFGMVRVSGGDARRILTGMVRETAPLYLGYTVLAFLFVVLWMPADVGPLSALLIMAPLFVSRWIYVQYGDEYRAHTRILETLVSASTRSERAGDGHGERVQSIAALIAADLGMNGRDAQDLRYASALHDIGLAGSIQQLLPGDEDAFRMTPDQWEAVRRHPQRAADIIQGIDFLMPAAAAIRHHHERVDGRGYPQGLKGQEIPLMSRILAVADGVASLLSQVGAVEDEVVVAELHAGAGTLYDSDVVASLARTVGTPGWRAVRAAAATPRGPGLWGDHDDPSVSGAFVTIAQEHTTYTEDTRANRDRPMGAGS